MKIKEKIMTNPLDPTPKCASSTSSTV